MNPYILKYIGQILASFTIILAVSGFKLAATVDKQTIEIESLKAQVMNVELINEKFLNVNKNFDDIKSAASKRDEKLDRILEKL